MSEKCIHKWYSRITRFAAYEFFCMACGKTLTANGFEEHATNLEARIAELEAVIDQLIEAGDQMAYFMNTRGYDEAQNYYYWQSVTKDRKENEQ